MKKYDIVKLINSNPYKINGLSKDDHGIVISQIQGNLEVLFFNPKNIGEYIIIAVKSNDVVLENESIPDQIKRELDAKIEHIRDKANVSFQIQKIHAYDYVELLVEDKKYSQYGIHKGARGYVMDDNAVDNFIEVDFSEIDEQGNFYGDCISVKINDLKKLK